MQNTGVEMEVDQATRPPPICVLGRQAQGTEDEFPEDNLSEEELFEAVRVAVITNEERIVPQVEDLYDYVADEVMGVNTLNLLLKANSGATLASQPPVIVQ